MFGNHTHRALRCSLRTCCRNIGTFNVHELFWMLQCNLTKSDDSTFFTLNLNWVFVRNWVLRYITENTKRSAESIPMLYTHSWYIWCKLNKMLKYNKYRLTKRWFNSKENSKAYSEFLNKMRLIECRIVTQYQDFYDLFIIVVVGCIIIIHEVFTCDSTQWNSR